MNLIIFGLGNTGKEYEKTRHNTGRIVSSLIAEKINSKSKIRFITPDSIMMNNSGKAILPFVKNKKDLKNLIVIYDDMDLPVGKFKISFNKSSGGHRGLESIIKTLKSEEFLRIRIGISPITPSGKLKKPTGKKNVINFILGEFKNDELSIIQKLSLKVTKAIETIITEGQQKAMSLFN